MFRPYSESFSGARQETRLRNPKESFKHLNSLLHKVSSDISSELERTFGIKELIDEDCNIRMEAYRDLDPQLVDEDTEAVADMEREWSRIDNPQTRAFYLQSYGLSETATDDEIIGRYMLERSKEKSRQLEMMMTVLLHKAFGQKYIVVRSAKHDDYFGGVDNVIVNKETGDVICAFDEVRESNRDDRRAEKDDRVLRRARSGGTELTYGFSVIAGKIELRSMSGLPLFCLGLNAEEYDELLNAIEYGDGQALNDIERKFLGKILSSIEEQKNRLLADQGVQRKSAVVHNLKKVDELLKFEMQ